MMEPFDFSDWSDYRKEQHLSELMDAAEIAHNETRKRQITRELTHLMFEMDYLAELKEKPHE